MEKTTFALGMKKLSDAHPEREVTKDTYEVYWERLQGLTDEEFQVAVAFALDTMKYFPKISELLDAVHYHKPTARDAWNFLIECAENGRSPEAVLGSIGPALKAGLAAIGGFESFQFTDFKELKFMFKDFKEAFERTMAQGPVALPAPEQKMLEEKGNGFKS
jgi:hypothetical protein